MPRQRSALREAQRFSRTYAELLGSAVHTERSLASLSAQPGGQHSIPLLLPCPRTYVCFSAKHLMSGVERRGPHLPIPLPTRRQHRRILLLGWDPAAETTTAMGTLQEPGAPATDIANHLNRNSFLCARQQPLTPAECLPAYTASIFGRENCLAHRSRKVANPSSTLKCHFLYWLSLPREISLRDKTVTTCYSLTLQFHSTRFFSKSWSCYFLSVVTYGSAS